MKRILLIGLLSTSALAMEPDEPAELQQKADDAMEAFQLAAQRRLLEITRINLESELKFSSKSDKDKIKRLKQQIKEKNAEMKALDKQLKKNK